MAWRRGEREGGREKGKEKVCVCGGGGGGGGVKDSPTSPSSKGMRL